MICLLNKRRARDAPAAEAADDVEQSFEDEAFTPAPRRRGRGSSSRGVLSQSVIISGVIYEWNCWIDYILL